MKIKIKNGRIQRICKNGADHEFREMLKKVLKSWFNLETRDIVEIIQKLGVTEKDYEIFYVQNTYFNLIFKVITSSDEFDVELFRGTMNRPYPLMKVIREGKETVYSLARIVEVERLI